MMECVVSSKRGVQRRFSWSALGLGSGGKLKYIPSCILPCNAWVRTRRAAVMARGSVSVDNVLNMLSSCDVDASLDAVLEMAGIICLNKGIMEWGRE